MHMTTRKLLLSTAALLAGVGVASAQGMQGGAAARGQAGAAAGISNGSGQVSAGASESSRGAADVRPGGRGEMHGTIGQAGPHSSSPNAAGLEHNRERGEASVNGRGGVNAREQHGTIGQASRENNTRQIEQGRERGRGSGDVRENANAREPHSTVGQASHEEKASRNAERNNAEMRDHARTPERATTGEARSQAQGGTSVQGKTSVQGETSDRGRNQVGANVEQNGGNRIQLSSQQTTHLRDTVLSRSNVPRLNHVDFVLRAGVVVPESVHQVRISEYPELVDVFPNYRNDEFFVTEDEIVIMTPERRIVEVVPLSASSHVGAVSGDVELSSAEIREIQQVLVQRGYDVEVDGVWGPTTREALITFQRREGLPATGVITMQTVAGLGLRGRIAESHIQGRASTVGQARDRDNERMTRESEQPNAKRGENRVDRQNANGPRGDRSTVGRAGDNEDRSKVHDNDRLSPNKSTTGRADDHQPQNQSMNGDRGRSQSAEGQGTPPRNQTTVGRSSGQSGAEVGDQPRGATGAGGMQQNRGPQKY